MSAPPNRRGRRAKRGAPAAAPELAAPAAAPAEGVPFSWSVTPLEVDTSSAEAHRYAVDFFSGALHVRIPLAYEQVARLGASLVESAKIARKAATVRRRELVAEASTPPRLA